MELETGNGSEATAYSAPKDYDFTLYYYIFYISNLKMLDYMIDDARVELTGFYQKNNMNVNYLIRYKLTKLTSIPIG